MVRVIHFSNLKPGTDEAQMLRLVNQGLLEITKFYGCLERKTWKLLDGNAEGQPTPVPASLWPSQEVADAFAHAVREGEAKTFFAEARSGIETVLTARYVDEEG